MSYNIRNLPPAFATPVLLYGKRTRSFPLAYDATHFLVEEHYLVKRSSYARQPNNTPNALYATAFLVEETIEREEQDGVWFKRIYATIPATFRDYQTYVGTYPAFLNGRSEFTESAPALALHEYFLVNGDAGGSVGGGGSGEGGEFTAGGGGSIGGGVGTGPGGTGSGGTGGAYDSVDLIPFIDQTRVAFSSIFSSPIPILAGGFFLNDGGAFVNASNPTLAIYQAWIAADAATASSYSLVVEASKPQRYMANIWERVTLYGKAR